MSILTKIFSAGASDLVSSIGGVVDNLTTSKEEKLEAQRKIQEVLMQAESQAQEQVTRRWEADMKSDNWLSKNIRPLICLFLTFIFVILSIFHGNVGNFSIDEGYIPIYQTLLITVYGAYFAGRSIEKIKKK